MSSDHECPAPGCNRRVPVTMLACSRHWYMLPAELRSCLWRVYRGQGPRTEAHREAVASCVEWLERNV